MLRSRDIIVKLLAFSDDLCYYDDLYQVLLLCHSREESSILFQHIVDQATQIDPTFRIVFRTFTKYKDYMTNTIKWLYFGAKLEVTTKPIKDTKC